MQNVLQGLQQPPVEIKDPDMGTWLAAEKKEIAAIADDLAAGIEDESVKAEGAPQGLYS